MLASSTGLLGHAHSDADTHDSTLNSYPQTKLESPVQVNRSSFSAHPDEGSSIVGYLLGLDGVSAP